MRILAVAPFPNWKWVSINRYASNLVKATSALGADVSLSHSPWWNPQSILHGIRVRYRSTSPALREHRQRPFDLVHLTDHALAHHVTWLGRRSPTVVTCHDLMPLEMPGYFKGIAETQVKSRLFRHSVRHLALASHVICVSEFTRSQVMRLTGVRPEQVSIIPNMLRHNLRRVTEPREQLRAAGIELPPGPFVLSIGHAGPYKNLELLIAAMASPMLKGAFLLRAGERLNGGQRELARRLGLEERIVEVGRVRASLLPPLYSVADVLAQPSLGEGFGVPVIEAMACGLPVVVSDGGALPEIAGEAGVVVSLRDAKEPHLLASALASVLDDQQLASRLRALGLERAGQFRPETVGPRLIELYRAVREEFVQPGS